MHPDKNPPSYALLNPPKKVPPKIIFGKTALKWIHALVDLHSEEVGFYAVVDKRPDYTFFIRDVFYPKHSVVSAAECEISPEGETIMMNWLLDNNREDDIEKVTFWGHSHVNMGTEPSPQDETQAFERMKSTGEIVIRAICNKKGQIAISFFDPFNQIRFDHIKWTIENDIPEEFEQEKINSVTRVLNDNQINHNSKIKKIKELLDIDTHTDLIRKKVIELKNKNLPANRPLVQNPRYRPLVQNPRYRSGGGITNLDLFRGDPYYTQEGYPKENDDPLSLMDDDLETGFENNINNDHDDIEDIKKEWEEGLEV